MWNTSSHVILSSSGPEGTCLHSRLPQVYIRMCDCDLTTEARSALNAERYKPVNPSIIVRLFAMARRQGFLL